VKRAFEYLQSLVVVVLVMAAIAGMSYYAFRDEGWVEKLTGNIWSLEMQYPLIAIPTSIATILLFRMWRHHRLRHGRYRQLPNIVIYALMAVGLYFVGRFVVHGSL
jgi:hypothetical protein